MQNLALEEAFEPVVRQDEKITFALIVYAHPHCARNSCRNATPRHASSARAEETFQPHIGRVAVAITSFAVCSLKWSVTPTFFLTDHFC